MECANHLYKQEKFDVLFRDNFHTKLEDHSRVRGLTFCKTSDALEGDFYDGIFDNKNWPR